MVGIIALIRDLRVIWTIAIFTEVKKAFPANFLDYLFWSNLIKLFTDFHNMYAPNVIMIDIAYHVYFSCKILQLLNAERFKGCWWCE